MTPDCSGALWQVAVGAHDTPAAALSDFKILSLHLAEARDCLTRNANIRKAPILVRADGARFVLLEGLHRLGAAKALGEKTIVAFLVDARKH
jgi:hypothetical protein